MIDTPNVRPLRPPGYESTHLTRPELSQLVQLVHDRINHFRPHKNESQDMFEFRVKVWRDLLIKLHLLFEETGR